MTRDNALNEKAERRVAKRAFAIGTALVLLIGLSWAETLGELAGYLMVVAASLLPALLWIRQGRPGVPVLPAMSVLCIIYYAIPIVRGREDLLAYSRTDVLFAAATVCLYLLVAALAAAAVLRTWSLSPRTSATPLRGEQVRAVVTIGLALGIVFLAGSAAGVLGWVGPFFGLVRSLALTSLVVACYFMGVARGRGLLRGRSWFLASMGLGLAVLVSWSSLFLVGGMIFLLALGVGYVTTRGRIPWLIVGLAILLVSILHAGKEEMRGRYWMQGASYGASTSVTAVPGLVWEWFKVGLTSYGEPSQSRSAIDRASLLHILLRVQGMTPGYVDYLQGETYRLLPGMLVPRFLDPTKTKSQAGMDLLNIRYGLLTVEGVEKTAVGWGLIAEAYANFGFFGVIAMGLLVGSVAGWATRKCAESSTVSAATLMAIALMIGLVNLEQDLASLVTSLLQSFVAVLAFSALIRVLPLGRSQRLSSNLTRMGAPEPPTARLFP